MENNKPNYYTILPAEVRYDNKLSDKAKLLFSEIYTLCKKNGFCFSTNIYFANLYSVSERTITRLIKELLDRTYISIKYDKNVYNGRQIYTNFNDKNVYDNNIIFNNNNLYYNNNNIKDNNYTLDYSINNNNNKKKEIIKKEKDFSNFEKLWSLYPRKEGKASAFKKYKNICNKVTDEIIKDGIFKYLKYIEDNRISNKYIKQGSTWFNGECWNDEYLNEDIDNDIEYRRI